MSERGRRILRIAIAALGIGLVIYGTAVGGPAAVLKKATMICMECVGIG